MQQEECACGFGGERRKQQFRRRDRPRRRLRLGRRRRRALGCLLPLVASRFGIGGVARPGDRLFPAELAWRLGGGGGGGLAPGHAAERASGPEQARPERPRISCCRSWLDRGYVEQVSRRLGGRYTPTTLVAYSQGYQSGCGAAQSAMGPFYCPTDKKIYLDPEFFNELSQRFQAPGDFAQAYVIAHEVGHHVQDLTGTLDEAHNAQARAERDRRQCHPGQGRASGRLLCRRVGRQRQGPAGQPVMEQGDFEEGMRAAEAIGDDTLQKQSQGVRRPGQLHPRHVGAADGSAPARLQERRSRRLQVLEPDEHLPGVLALEQAEERVGRVLEAVDDRLARLDRRRSRASGPSRA